MNGQAGMEWTGPVQAVPGQSDARGKGSLHAVDAATSYYPALLLLCAQSCATLCPLHPLTRHTLFYRLACMQLPGMLPPTYLYCLPLCVCARVRCQQQQLPWGAQPTAPQACWSPHYQAPALLSLQAPCLKEKGTREVLPKSQPRGGGEPGPASSHSPLATARPKQFIAGWNSATLQGETHGFLLQTGKSRFFCRKWKTEIPAYHLVTLIRA